MRWILFILVCYGPGDADCVDYRGAGTFETRSLCFEWGRVLSEKAVMRLGAWSAFMDCAPVRKITEWE